MTDPSPAEDEAESIDAAGAVLTPKALSINAGAPSSADTDRSSDPLRLRCVAFLISALSSISITTVRMSPSDCARLSPNSDDGPERQSEPDE